VVKVARQDAKLGQVVRWADQQIEYSKRREMVVARGSYTLPRTDNGDLK